jgi:hypothetical protein
MDSSTIFLRSKRQAASRKPQAASVGVNTCMYLVMGSSISF